MAAKKNPVKRKKKKYKTTAELVKGYSKFMEGKEINPEGLEAFSRALGNAVKNK